MHRALPFRTGSVYVLNVGCVPFSVCCTVWPCLAALRADELNSLLHLLRAVSVVPSAGGILWSSSFVMPHSAFALFPVMFEVVQRTHTCMESVEEKRG